MNPPEQQPPETSEVINLDFTNVVTPSAPTPADRIRQEMGRLRDEASETVNAMRTFSQKQMALSKAYYEARIKDFFRDVKIRPALVLTEFNAAQSPQSLDVALAQITEAVRSGKAPMPDLILEQKESGTFVLIKFMDEELIIPTKR